MTELLILAQIQLADTTAQALEESGEMTLSYWELAFKGGWVMIPILVLSVIAVFIFVERFFVVRQAQREDALLMNRIKDYIHEGKVESALALCQSQNSPVSRMLEKGLKMIGRPIRDVNAALENVGKLEIYKLEKGLPALATVAGGAPMIGFLGTVIGMIISFYDMSNAGNNINVSLLSNGIYTALVTTVAGLIVGIIAYFAYNILVAKVEKVVFMLEARTSEFIDLLNEPVND
jgi:biopolymer transport protein ExbB